MVFFFVVFEIEWKVVLNLDIVEDKYRSKFLVIFVLWSWNFKFWLIFLGINVGKYFWDLNVENKVLLNVIYYILIWIFLFENYMIVKNN